MDYVEAFKNLRTNNKYGRKSPHKAVLMLTVIELYDQNILTDNEIFYDEKLKSMFLKVWNRVLPNEPLFHPEAYLPFWYLQNDSFWHIVPVRGKEDILSLMRDTNIKPSEAKLNDSVRCAELDDDLYFLMTIASGRTSLKRALLETYTQLSDNQIERLSESMDNVVDHSLSAMDEYEQILTSKNSNETVPDKESSTELEKQFKKLSDDLQIALNYEYFSFLKNRRSERDLLRDFCPDVFALYDYITNHPVHRTDISPSLAFIYDNFLSDLKIALMSENGSMDLIDKIEAAIEILRGNNVADNIPDIEEQIVAKDDREGKKDEYVEDKWKNDNALDVEHVYLDSNYNIVKTVTTSSLKDASENEEVQESRKGKAWTHEEEERITHYFERGISTADIAERVGRTEVAIKVRLAKLGLIEYTYGQDESDTESLYFVPVNLDDFQIENGFTKTNIFNTHGEKVFTDDGKLKIIRGKLYRLKLQNQCFTIKGMRFNGEVWMKGDKKIVAYPQTLLYKIIDEAYDYSEAIEDLFDGASFPKCKVKVNGCWYDNQGDLITDSSVRDDATEESPQKSHDYLKIIKHPLYAVRKQAIIRAMGFFRIPTNVKDIARMISRTAWGSTIKEEDVGEIINTISEVEYVEGKYFLKDKRGINNTLNNKTTSSSEKITLTPSKRSKAKYGNWIKWNPTGVTGKVIGFKKSGSLQKIVIRTKKGNEIEVYDNPKVYDVVL